MLKFTKCNEKNSYSQKRTSSCLLKQVSTVSSMRDFLLKNGGINSYEYSVQSVPVRTESETVQKETCRIFRVMPYEFSSNGSEDEFSSDETQEKSFLLLKRAVFLQKREINGLRDRCQQLEMDGLK